MSAMRPFPPPIDGAADPRAAGAEPLLDAVGELAREAFGAPVGLVIPIGGDARRGPARLGIDVAPLAGAFSPRADGPAPRGPLIVTDALADPRWAGRPVVVDGRPLRFFVGVPVILEAGPVIGAVCVADTEPRPAPTSKRMALLEHLAGIVAGAHDVPAGPDTTALAGARGRARTELPPPSGHELRTPLEGVLGLLDLPGSPERGQVLAAALRGCGARLCTLVGDASSPAGPGSREATLDEGEHDLDAMLGRVAGALEPLARTRGKTVEHAHGGAGRASVDAAGLEVAVACLVSHVVMHGGREAEVSAWRRPGGGIVIEVSDDGRGVDAPGQAGPLARLGEGAPRGAGAAGLGLTLARWLAELHGGELALVRAGERSLARIELPPHRSRRG